MKVLCNLNEICCYFGLVEQIGLTGIVDFDYLEALIPDFSIITRQHDL